MGSAKQGGNESALSVRFLGGFAVSSEQGPITIESARLRSLLAHLVLHRGEDQPRERLAYLFWPDSGESQARTNMRQALHRLRHTLPDPDLFLRIEKSTVAWRADAPFSLDVHEFEERASSDESESIARAVEIYAGDLLPECYDDWVVPLRERLRVTFLAASARLAERIELERDYRRAIPVAKQLLDNDPLNEESCRRLMRLHALCGDRAAALTIYHGFATTLARKAGVEPSPETRGAYDRLVEPETDDVSESRSYDAPAAGPLVGREDGWGRLREAWRQASRGACRLVAVTGEAGIGKSRLAEELRHWVSCQGYAVASTRCYAAAGRLAYAPLADLLRSDAIESSVRELGDSWLVELSRVVPELLDERPDLPQPLPLTDDWQRARLLDAVTRAFVGTDEPLLLILDDLQWCDDETIRWLGYLLRSSPAAPLLVLATARSEELHGEHPAQVLILEAQAEGQADEIELDRLDRSETAALARGVAGSDLSGDRNEAIFRETEGNPFFVVEWTRAGLESAPAHTPPRVQSVIETRFRQLSDGAQQLASLAATVGREFDTGVLVSASSRSEDDVIAALDELRDRRIVRELTGAAYDFSHDKLRDAAYLRAGEARRRVLHRRVAQATESHAKDLDSVAAELGAHYEQAGWADRASGFYARAAENAHRVYANERAIVLFEQALTLLESEPSSPLRDERELSLRTALGPPLVSIEGYGAPKVHDDYQRAWELCEHLSVPPTPPVLRGLALVSIARGELARARDLGAELLDLGIREDEPTVRVEGSYVLGVTVLLAR